MSSFIKPLVRLRSGAYSLIALLPPSLCWQTRRRAQQSIRYNARKTFPLFGAHRAASPGGPPLPTNSWGGGRSLRKYSESAAKYRLKVDLIVRARPATFRASPATVQESAICNGQFLVVIVAGKHWFDDRLPGRTCL